MKDSVVVIILHYCDHSLTLTPVSPLQDGDSTSLTTDNLERHGQMTHNAALPGGGALLSEAKLQSIMSFLDEMEQSEQERPRSGTSGSHRGEEGGEEGEEEDAT